MSHSRGFSKDSNGNPTAIESATTASLRAEIESLKAKILAVSFGVAIYG